MTIYPWSRGSSTRIAWLATYITIAVCVVLTVPFDTGSARVVVTGIGTVAVIASFYLAARARVLALGTGPVAIGGTLVFLALLYRGVFSGPAADVGLMIGAVLVYTDFAVRLVTRLYRDRKTHAG